MLIVTLDLSFKADQADTGAAVMARVLDETRGFAGCIGVEALVQRDDTLHWLVVERWESAEADLAYREFRRGPGAITDLGPTLAGRPTMMYWDELRAPVAAV